MSLTKTRRRLIRVCLAERPLSEWLPIFDRVAASDYLAGRTERRAPVTLDWLIARPDPALQVLEGQFDNRPPRRATPPVFDEEQRRLLEADRGLPRHLARVRCRLRQTPTVAFAPALLDRITAIDEELRVLQADGQQLAIDHSYERKAAARLEVLDRELLMGSKSAIERESRIALMREADLELAPYRAGMTAERYQEAYDHVFNRLVREHFKLPTLSWEFRPAAGEKQVGSTSPLAMTAGVVAPMVLLQAGCRR